MITIKLHLPSILGKPRQFWFCWVPRLFYSHQNAVKLGRLGKKEAKHVSFDSDDDRLASVDAFLACEENFFCPKRRFSWNPSHTERHNTINLIIWIMETVTIKGILVNLLRAWSRSFVVESAELEEERSGIYLRLSSNLNSRQNYKTSSSHKSKFPSWNQEFVL